MQKGLVVCVCLIFAAVVVTVAVLSYYVHSGRKVDDACADDAPEVASAYGEYRYAAVADDIAQCSSVGIYILAERGGSLTDAVIATALCNGVINQQHSGLGGGFILVVNERNSSGSLVSREQGPSYATVDYYRHLESLVAHPNHMAVPREVAGYWEAHQKYGQLPWAELFTPSIEIAEKGWRVTKTMAKNIQEQWETMQHTEHVVMREFVTNKNGSQYKEGDMMKDPQLAETLRRIAKDGADTFYKGDLQKDIIDDIKEAGGNMTADDLSSARKPVWSSPVSVTLGDATLLTSGLPGQGLVVAHALQILTGFNYTNSSVETDEDWALLYHRFAETFKLLKNRRFNLGDSDDPVAKEWFAKFQDARYASYLRGQIEDSTVRESTEYDTEEGDQDTSVSTSHFSIYGPGGTAASFTTTVGRGWGCKIKGRRTGIVFNSNMLLFTNPSKSNVSVNYPAKNKSPRSSTSPVLLLEKDSQAVMMSTGGSGGSRIMPAVTWVVLLSHYLRISVEKAVSMPRVFASSQDNRLYYDEDMSEGILHSLRARGHEMIPAKSAYPYLAVIQAFTADLKACVGGPRDKTCVTAVSDYRKGGAPDGF